MLPKFNCDRIESVRKSACSPFAERKSPLCVLQIQISSRPRIWLLLAALILQILILVSLRYLPAAIVSVPVPTDSCSFGRVFVYDLPRIFNKDLIDDCERLNPWNSRCDALENDGFGREAFNGVAGLVPEDLRQAWYWTDQFASEIIYHKRMLNHRCRTMDSDSATAFYVPFYAGLAVGKYLWSNYSARERDRHCELLLEWIEKQEPWMRSNGADHFMMLGRITWDFRRSRDEDWGGSFLYMPGMRNVTRLLIERNPWDDLDVAVPYPTGFHPRSEAEVRAWQSHVLNRPRRFIFSFAGATRSSFPDDFRAGLLRQCLESHGSCGSVDCTGSRCSNGSWAALGLFLDSDFCLQPRGDSFTRRSIFDCMIAGSIPVFFWRRSAYLQYTWHLPDDPESYSVFIDRTAVKNGTSIKEVLDSLGSDKTKKMREKVVEYIPRLLYVAPEEGLPGNSDAFDIAVDGVLRRFHSRSTIVTASSPLMERESGE